MPAKDLNNPTPEEMAELVTIYFRERWGDELEVVPYQKLPMKAGFTFMNSTAFRFEVIYWNGLRWLYKNRP